MLALKKDRSKSLSDLLNWCIFVAPGVIMNKDGSFMVGWRYVGPDLDSATASELMALVNAVNTAFTFLETGWILNVDAIRHISPGYPMRGAFPDPTTALIDEERRRMFNLAEGHDASYESQYYLTLTWLTPPDVEQSVKKFLFETHEETGVEKIGDVLPAFIKQVERIESFLSSHLSMARLDNSGIISFLSACLRGSSAIAMNPPTLPIFLDVLLAQGAGDLTGGIRPIIGRNHIRTITIAGFPNESYPGILDALNSIPSNYRWSTRFLALSTEDAKKILEKTYKHWMQRRFSLAKQIAKYFGSGDANATPNLNAVEMADDVQIAMKENDSRTVKYGYYTTTIVISGETEKKVDEDTKEIQKVLSGLGFMSMLEENNAVEAFLGSLPGHGAIYQVHKNLISTANLSDMLPTTSVWPGNERNVRLNGPPLIITRTRGQAQFRFSTHYSDVGHSFVIGPSGAGKSTLIALMMAQFFRYPRARVYCFDFKYAAYGICTASFGKHYDILSGHQRLTFAPLANIDDKAERNWAANWLEMMISLQLEGTGEALTPGDRELIMDALTTMASDPNRMWTISDFYQQIQSQTIKSAIKYYTAEGPLGDLLDSKENSLEDGRFVVFEMENLMSPTLGKKSVAPVLDYLFHWIERSLDGSPTMICLDEAWTMLNHDMFKSKIEAWLRTMRSKNAAVVFATQSIADVVKSSIKDVILGQTPTRIYLPNKDARSESVREFYMSMDLNDREIEILADATYKQHYYFKSPDGRRLFSLMIAINSATLAFCGVSHKEDIAAMREFQEKHGEIWPFYWLKSRKLVDEAEEWRDLYWHIFYDGVVGGGSADFSRE